MVRLDEFGGILDLGEEATQEVQEAVELGVWLTKKDVSGIAGVGKTEGVW